MDLKSLDELGRAKDLVSGMFDIMVFIETAKQDTAIPVTVFSPFEAILDKVFLLLEGIEKREKEK